MTAKIFISNSREIINKEIDETLRTYGFKNPHPDLLYYPFDSKLGIEQARQIKTHLSFKPYQSKGKAVVLEDASNLTAEAQNALLKTLEELPSDALFIMGADSDSSFLPTVLSRSEIIRIDSLEFIVGSLEFDKDIEKLLQENIEERFEYISNLKEKEEFLHSLVKYFHKNLASHIGSGNVEFLQELLTAEKWAKQNVNLRAILEYLMMKMPGN